MVILKNNDQRKSRNGPSKKLNENIKIIRKINPNCSNIIIVSVLTLKIANSNFDPSRGGIGIRLKKAKRTFQRITMEKIVKNMEPTEPAITVERTDQFPRFPIISCFKAIGIEINLAAIANTKAMVILDKGPPRATNAGPHFWFLKL